MLSSRKYAIFLTSSFQGQQQSGASGSGKGGDKGDDKDKKKKYEPPIPTRVGKKRKRTKGPDTALKLPQGIDILLSFRFLYSFSTDGNDLLLMNTNFRISDTRFNCTIFKICLELFWTSAIPNIQFEVLTVHGQSQEWLS